MTTENNNILEYKEKIINILCEFLGDILRSFPEYNETLQKPLVNILLYKNGELEEYSQTEFDLVTQHLRQTLSPLFFDIIQENEEIFELSSEKNTELLPGIDFKDLWKQELSDNSKQVLFKYLQILLVQLSFDASAEDFGDTQNLFSAIPQDEFKNMMEQMLQNITEHFDNKSETVDGSPGGTAESGGVPNIHVPDISNINLGDLPNAEQIHEHMNSMLGGKIGSIAREIAEEISKDFNVDLDNDSTTGDAFKKLFKNPAKMMNMVKKIGNKLEEKMSDESINKEELMSEAMDLMNNMKNMPGMPDMNSLLSSMGLGGGGGSKINFNQMQANMQHMQKQNSMKEGMLKRLEERKKKRAALQAKQQNIEGMENLVFTKGDSVHRSGLKERNSKLDTSNKTSLPTKNNKKNKKKKQKKKGKK